MMELEPLRVHELLERSENQQEHGMTRMELLQVHEL